MKNDNLDLASFLLQLINLEILFKDFKNTDIMQELQKQNTQYFEKILKNQNEILTLLRKEEK